MRTFLLVGSLLWLAIDGVAQVPASPSNEGKRNGLGLSSEAVCPATQHPGYFLRVDSLYWSKWLDEVVDVHLDKVSITTVFFSTPPFDDHTIRRWFGDIRVDDGMEACFEKKIWDEGVLISLSARRVTRRQALWMVANKYGLSISSSYSGQGPICFLFLRNETVQLEHASGLLPDRRGHWTSVWNTTEDIFKDLKAKGGQPLIRKFIEERCGRFDSDSSFGFNPNLSLLVVSIPISDRYRFMKGMKPLLRITEADLQEQREIMKKWSPEKAAVEAKGDIARGMIKIYWAGGIGSSPCGIPAKYAPLVQKFPKADAGIGCSSIVPPEALFYGKTYNQIILDYLLNKL